MFEGKVEAVEGDVIRLSCPGLERPIEVEQPDTPPIGSTAWAALRPEKIDISKEPPPDPTVNTTPGKIEEITYLGEVSIYHVRISDGLPLVKVAMANIDRVTRRPFTWEDEVYLSWTRQCGVVLDR